MLPHQSRRSNALTISPPPRPGLALCLLTVLLACEPGKEPTLPSSSAWSTSGFASTPVPRTVDDVFDEIGKSVEAFAGLYLDSTGFLVIRLTDVTRAAAALAATEIADDDIEGLAAMRSSGRVRVEPADYSFAALNGWRRRIYTSRPEGLTLLDVDEVRNRVVVGTVPEFEASVRRALEALDVPAAAVIVQTGPRPRRQATLSDSIRPVPGGMKVHPVGWYDGCTIGANAESGGEPGFLTAAHCTPLPGSVGHMQEFYQPTYTSGDYLGMETVDPELLPQGETCSASDGCRFSDAVWVAYEYSIDVQQGYLARTSNFTGSTTINSSKPRFVIADAPMTTLTTGAQVYKIGHIGGGTTGTVTATCVDWLGWYDSGYGDPIDADLLCQTAASYSSSGGDSGGPIFSWNGTSDSVTFRGIHVGIYDGAHLFSPWRHIYIEFSGQLDLEVLP